MSVHIYNHIHTHTQPPPPHVYTLTIHIKLCGAKLEALGDQREQTPNPLYIIEQQPLVAVSSLYYIMYTICRLHVGSM